MRASPRALVFAAIGLALASGCDRAMEPFVPGEKPEPPDLARIFPEGAERAAEQEANAGGQPGMRGGRGAPPVASAPATAEEPAPIRGTVSLAPQLASGVPAGAVLFLIARHGESGPPLAVQRIAGAELPLEFSIGPDDRMIEAIPFEGPLRLTARIDADGNATTRSPGDLQGAAAGAHQPGDADVAILIDQVLD
jgi:hypothetical protein